MLELSLSPHDRLLHLLKYSRPTGMNKRIRSYVVNKKNVSDGMTEDDELKAREEKAEKVREEKRQLIRKKCREQEIKVNTVRAMGAILPIPPSRRKNIRVS
uniref:IBB domain-containing protein n=1 Tax=Heterorhabditis bacteriophora TaxID=37862 RepID=A0A1I7XN72_HETBA